MIRVFTGRMGSGKSYAAVQCIIDDMRKGRIVYTNNEMHFSAVADLCRRRFSIEVKPEQLVELPEAKIKRFFENISPGSAVYIDEAHLYFNARDWSQCDRQLLNFLSQARHVGVDVTFVTQHESNIDKQFLRLAAEIWRFRDMRNFKPFGMKLPLPMFTASQYDFDGKTLLNFYYRRIDKDIFKCYDSFAMLSTFPMLEPVKVKVTVNKRIRRMKIVIFVIAVLCLCGFGYAKLSDSFGTPAKVVENVGKAGARADTAMRAPVYSQGVIDSDRGVWLWSFIGSTGSVYLNDGEIVRVGGRFRGGRLAFASGEHLVIVANDGTQRDIVQDEPRGVNDKIYRPVVAQDVSRGFPVGPATNGGLFARMGL